MICREMICSNLSLLIDYFNVPALLISFEDQKILYGNSAAIKNYGIAFAENRPIEIKDQYKYENSYWKLEGRVPNPVFVPSTESDGNFQLINFSPAYSVLLEFYKGKALIEKDRGKKVIKKTTSGSQLPPFHFSYIYNFSTGKRSYSHTELLVNLGLLKSSNKNLDWRSIILKEDLPLYDNTIESVRQHGGNHEIHYRIVSPEGQIIKVCDYCSLNENGGKWPVLAGSIISSERSSREIQFAERQVLVGRLVGGMIHDFKNLLGGIQNIIEWSITMLMLSSSERKNVVKALEQTLTYSEQAAKLLTGALKVSSGKRDTKIEEVYLSDIIKDLKSLIRHIIPASITLKINIADNIPAVYGHKSVLQDMILNLCVNARDAMKTKGDLLCIDAYTLLLPDEHGNDQCFIKLNVTDNGCGMSKADVKSVFDAFFSTKESGVGLGLWMVREAVHSLDGRIDIKSELGKGTVMELLFPVIERKGEECCVPVVKYQGGAASAVSEKAAKKAFSLTGTKTVLYIEDDPLIRSSISSWLESLGLKILVSGDGNEGYQMFVDNMTEIDLVIQDYVLPGKRGDQLLAEFVALKPDIPVIVASAESDRDDLEELCKKGAFAFISKPFRMEDLLNIIARVFNK